MDEFELIRRYFTRATSSNVRLGIGDDAALLDVIDTLAISTDALIEGHHFFSGVDPEALGHKALAVNLSDLAAMGATPLAFTLALGLPPARAADDAWLSAFAGGLYALAESFGCALIGGDTTASPVVMVTITVMGTVPAERAMKRSDARVGDDIYVSGRLGDASLALKKIRQGTALTPSLRASLERPTPRVALGVALRGIARAAIDISDGLTGDLPHILNASHVGASIFLEKLPCVAEARWHHVLAGGDDYELCFTAAPEQAWAVEQAAKQAQVTVTRVGTIDAEPGCRWLLHGEAQAFDLQGFNHFSV